MGAGAIGSFFAAYLLEGAVAEVTLCARTPFQWLVIESERWGETVRSKPQVLVDPAEAVERDAPVDWLLLATKAHQTAGAAGWLSALVGPGTTVVVLQNGVEQVERVRPFVTDDARVLPAVVYSGVEMLGPGHAVHRTNGFFYVPPGGAEPGGPADADRLGSLFPSERQFVRAADDFVTEAWSKLAANVAVNGITALTGRRVEVVRRPDVSSVVGSLLDETVAVGTAEGARFPEGFSAEVRRRQAAFPDGAGTSMLYDRLAGRPMEEDAIYGAVVRAARRHAVATPVCDAVLALLAAISEPARSATVAEPERSASPA